MAGQTIDVEDNSSIIHTRHQIRTQPLCPRARGIRSLSSVTRDLY